eukprot:TRINITY_DN5522_c0_g1_i2.p1 TRINITY_DN5522_c0_g1~~TRINITY_DN5522_c0_g1_i2.p1  ORF type:complete len:398 (-),score=47.29 TRINITY_DN5522_c0_g1_i2:109-1245(-)
MWQGVALSVAWATLAQAVVLRSILHEQVGRSDHAQHASNLTTGAEVGAAHNGFHDNASSKDAKKASAVDHGNLQCMRWTGGTCLVFGCFLDRGKTECIEGKCMCPAGYCSNTQGVCEYRNNGKDIGTHSVRFVNAHDQSQPYLGVTQSTEGWGSPKEITASVSDPSAQWKMVLTPHGYVRFESTLLPEHVLTIYNNRRRRTHSHFLQVEEQATNATNSSIHQHAERTTGEDARAGISDSDDLWPVVRKIETVTPLQASFLIREVDGGLEVWDPENGVSLASSDTNQWFADDMADHGVAECKEENWFYEGCKGREVVAFEPPLAQEALSPKGHILVAAFSALRWYHILGIVLIFVAIFFCLFFAIVAACVAADRGNQAA